MVGRMGEAKLSLPREEHKEQAGLRLSCCWIQHFDSAPFPFADLERRQPLWHRLSGVSFHDGSKKSLVSMPSRRPFDAESVQCLTDIESRFAFDDPSRRECG